MRRMRIRCSNVFQSLVIPVRNYFELVFSLGDHRMSCSQVVASSACLTWTIFMSKHQLETQNTSNRATSFSQRSTSVLSFRWVSGDGWHVHSGVTWSLFCEGTFLCLARRYGCEHRWPFRSVTPKCFVGFCEHGPDATQLLWLATPATTQCHQGFALAQGQATLKEFLSVTTKHKTTDSDDFYFLFIYKFPIFWRFSISLHCLLSYLGVFWGGGGGR